MDLHLHYIIYVLETNFILLPGVSRNLASAFKTFQTGIHFY